MTYSQLEFFRHPELNLNNQLLALFFKWVRGASKIYDIKHLSSIMTPKSSSLQSQRKSCIDVFFFAVFFLGDAFAIVLDDWRGEF